MKKFLSILLILVMGASLIACGSSEEVTKTPALVAADSDIKETSDHEKQETSADAEATIDEVVLVEEAGVKITAKSLEMDEIFGPELKLLIENNSGKDLTFQCRNVSVNGYMVETMMSEDVANGKKANTELTFMASDLDVSGITAIADMEFSFHVFDMVNWEDYLDTKPIQLKTSIADTYEYIFDDSGDLAYEGNGVKIIIKGLAEDAFFGPSVVVYIENNSDKNITVQTRNVSINGFMIDPIFSSDIAANKKAVDTITFMETDLLENDITAIEDIELSFHIYDADSWNTIFDTDVVAITF